MIRCNQCEKISNCPYGIQDCESIISTCDEFYFNLAEHDKQIREEVIEFISDKLIYPLLDEYDRGLWEHISYIELAEEWIKVLDDNSYPKVKNHTESRKRDLRQWIAEQLKEQENE